MDRIFISDLHARCVIGVGAEERREKQDVVVNLSLYAELARACGSDKFEDTVDYRAIKKLVLALVENSKYALVEALAQSIADACLTTPGVMKVQVRVEKPQALRFARSAGVEIERRRET